MLMDPLLELYRESVNTSKGSLMVIVKPSEFLAAPDQT